MSQRRATDGQCFRSLPLAAAIGAAFTLWASASIAATVPVLNCKDDSSSGSLRAVIGAATTHSGDTVDLSGLPATGCSTISLLMGAIPIHQLSLDLKGPRTGLVIGNGFGAENRIFTHTGTGELALEYLTITGGTAYSKSVAMYGGCINSSGSVALNHSTVEQCSVDAFHKRAGGGGVYTKKDLTLTFSTIARNGAGGGVSEAGIGGGAFVHGSVTASHSTISDNSAGDGNTGRAGGIEVGLGLSLSSSTVSGNRAGSSIGGIEILGDDSGHYTAAIVNSTISGNRASTGFSGGIFSYSSVSVQNSTIAFNTAFYQLFQTSANYETINYYVSAGLAIMGTRRKVTANIESSLIVNNSVNAQDYSSYKGRSDFSAFGGDILPTVTGSHNIIGVSSTDSMPFAISPLCPRLLPLRDNGGDTATHAVWIGSAGVDAGSNVLGLQTDQRGAPFNRADHGAPDIGAYESQQEDVIFNPSFDDCSAPTATQ